MRGRRVLITGATGHLGRVMAETLAEMGATILLLDRPGSDFNSLTKVLVDRWGVGVDSIECDLEFEDQREFAIERVKGDGKGLNCLINNAAFVGTAELAGWSARFEEQSLATWRRAMEVNLTATFHLCQGLAPQLRSSKGGNIVNITSIYADHGPDWSLYQGTSMGNPAAYGASKAGLAQLTRWLATTLAPDVRVNAISPGGVFRGQSDEFRAKYEARTPQRRMANESDFKGAIALLASDASSYINGSTIVVDGGWGSW
jgi:NAD(P)-dependent dehydrogenase (short-subunit alcohol dehydrogenase family)